MALKNLGLCVTVDELMVKATSLNFTKSGEIFDSKPHFID